MQIEYRWLAPSGARCRFAQFRARDLAQIQAQMRQWQHRISEASTQGTGQDQILWQTATQPDRDLWGRAQQHRNQANTLLSVLSGGLSKLESGGDLSERQMQNLISITECMREMGLDPGWQFQLVERFSHTGSRVRDLQTGLLYE